MGFNELLQKGDFLPVNPNFDSNNYLWDDWDMCNELVKNYEGLSVYTVISEDNKCWVVEGFRLANRLGYLFSKTHVELNVNVQY